MKILIFKESLSRYLLFFKQLKLFSHQLNSKKNVPVLLFKTTVRH